ncbi:MAG: cyclic nucleotide-binding domain-containing protein, partial [Zetaproteobacteria bacterium]
MALTDDAFLHACLRLHHAYPYDARVARLAIQALQRKGELRRAGELARRMSERLLAKGMGTQALGFVEIARKFLGDSPELDREAEMARLAVGEGGSAEVPHFELIEALSDEEAAAFLRRGSLVPAQKDEAVVREGERDRVFYLILSGEFDVMLANEARVGSLHAGEFFGEAACIYGLPRTASVVARTEAELLAFSEEAVQALAREFPLAGDYLKRVVDRRLIMTLTYQHPAFAEVPPGDRAWVADEAAIEDWREGETRMLSQMGDALW